MVPEGTSPRSQKPVGRSYFAPAPPYPHHHTIIIQNTNHKKTAQSVQQLRRLSSGER